MAAALKATSVNVSFSAPSGTVGGGKSAAGDSLGVTTINVAYVYHSTAPITSEAAATKKVLEVLNLVPEKPPGSGRNFNLKSCNASQEAGSKPVINVSAVFDDATPTATKDGGKASGGGGGGGGRGSCLPKDTETTTTVKAMKDFPITNSCGTPILPTPQIEISLLQRTKVTYQKGSDTAAAQNELLAGVGNIDQDETEAQNRKLGIDMQDQNNCPPDPGAPPPANEDGQILEQNRPCGSLLQGGSVGDVQHGPCGPYFAVTKTFIDGNFSAPGIAQVGYAKCGDRYSGGGKTAHTVKGPDGRLIPIVALEGIGGGVIPWPGQPGKK